jgi:hypothetical protein
VNANVEVSGVCPEGTPSADEVRIALSSLEFSLASNAGVPDPDLSGRLFFYQAVALDLFRQTHDLDALDEALAVSRRVLAMH